MIKFYFEESKPIALKKQAIAANIKQLIEKEGKFAGNINYIFSDDEYLLSINRQYLNHDFYTDVISFNYCEDDIISGDIFISIERVKENAIEFNVPFYDELFRVMIHGVLHFIGYADKSAHDEKIMREKENEYLNLFKK